MKRFFILLLFPALANAQFAPAAGQPGTSAIHKDSSAIIGWAVSCNVTRGWQDISDHSLGYTSHGSTNDALGKADGLNVISLGDAGEAVLTFNPPIRNGNGPDLCVFENSFDPGFLELAFVEVSSDGINYTRFPATSNNSFTLQLGPFDTWSDASKLNNLAGKYIANYGVPFDLEELKDIPGLNIEAITHVKIIDVVGSIQPAFARKDKNFNTINDPWPTAFPQGGFDLDAVGVLNQAPTSINESALTAFDYLVYPLIATDFINIITSEAKAYELMISNVQGKILMKESKLTGNTILQLNDIPAGIYFLKINSGSGSLVKKIVKQD